MRLTQLYRIAKTSLLSLTAVCAILPAQAAPTHAGRLTFNKDIAPMIYEQCASCHHPGDVAPFSLLTYRDVQKRAQQIAIVTAKRLMPPWKVESHGEFQGERHLTTAQIDLLKRWVGEGAAEGNPADLPTPPHFSADWMLGAPDLVLEPAASYQLAAEGRDVYRCFVVPTHFNEDRYVSALDVRPGARAVVHHIIAYVDTSGTARKLDGKESQPGYSTGGGIGFFPAGMLGGWAPGSRPLYLPAGTGILLPKGADVVLEVHYHKDGKAETDRSKVALYFNKQPVERPLHLYPLLNFGIRIPAGDSNYRATASIPVTRDATLIEIFPHMHMLGRRMTVTATLPDGTQQPLVNVPDWDFNWQGFYAYKDPIKLPRGSKIELAAYYDNSTGNPRNPNSPPKEVTWGEQTTDEMCLAYLGFTYDAEHIRQSASSDNAPAKGKVVRQ